MPDECLVPRTVIKGRPLPRLRNMPALLRVDLRFEHIDLRRGASNEGLVRRVDGAGMRLARAGAAGETLAGHVGWRWRTSVYLLRKNSLEKGIYRTHKERHYTTCRRRRWPRGADPSPSGS